MSRPRGERLATRTVSALARRALASLLAVAVAAGTLLAIDVAVNPETARALSGSEFDPGYIISDANFYNGQAMSSAEIQAFLDARIGSCLNSQCLNVATVPVDNQAGAVLVKHRNLICLSILRRYPASLRAPLPGAGRLRHLGEGRPRHAPEGAELGDEPGARARGRSTTRWGSPARIRRPATRRSRGLPARSSPAPRSSATRRLASRGSPDALHPVPPQRRLRRDDGQRSQLRDGRALQLHAVPAQRGGPRQLVGIGDQCSSYGNRNFWTYYANGSAPRWAVPCRPRTHCPS